MFTPFTQETETTHCAQTKTAPPLPQLPQFTPLLLQQPQTGFVRPRGSDTKDPFRKRSHTAHPDSLSVQPYDNGGNLFALCRLAAHELAAIENSDKSKIVNKTSTATPDNASDAIMTDSDTEDEAVRPDAADLMQDSDTEDEVVQPAADVIQNLDTEEAEQTATQTQRRKYEWTIDSQNAQLLSKAINRVNKSNPYGTDTAIIANMSHAFFVRAGQILDKLPSPPPSSEIKGKEKRSWQLTAIKQKKQIKKKLEEQKIPAEFISALTNLADKKILDTTEATLKQYISFNKTSLTDAAIDELITSHGKKLSFTKDYLSKLKDFYNQILPDNPIILALLAEYVFYSVRHDYPEATMASECFAYEAYKDIPKPQPKRVVQPYTRYRELPEYRRYMSSNDRLVKLRKKYNDEEDPKEKEDLKKQIETLETQVPKLKKLADEARDKAILENPASFKLKKRHAITTTDANISITLHAAINDETPTHDGLIEMIGNAFEKRITQIESQAIDAIPTESRLFNQYSFAKLLRRQIVTVNKYLQSQLEKVCKLSETEYSSLNEVLKNIIEGKYQNLKDVSLEKAKKSFNEYFEDLKRSQPDKVPALEHHEKIIYALLARKWLSITSLENLEQAFFVINSGDIQCYADVIKAIKDITFRNIHGGALCPKSDLINALDKYMKRQHPATQPETATTAISDDDMIDENPSDGSITEPEDDDMTDFEYNRQLDPPSG